MAACSRGAALSRVASASSRTRSMRAWALRNCSWNPPSSRPTSGSRVGTGIIGCVLCAEVLDGRAAGALRQDLDPLLRGLQGGLAIARQLHAALEAAQGLIERQVTRLHARDQRLELSDRGLKAGFLGFGHVCLCSSLRDCAPY